MSVAATQLFAGSAAPAIAGLSLPTTLGQPAQQAKEKLPPANFWLNVGYSIEVPMTDGTVESRFVSLPVGIPLDTQKPIEVRGKTSETVALLSAKNNLLEQLNALAKTLQPGEERILAVGANGLAIQLRRVAADAEAVPESNNVFLKTLNFAA